MKRWGGLHDNDFLRTDASNLAAYLYHLSREYPDFLEGIERTVRLGITIFDHFVFKPRILPTQEEQINPQWRQKIAIIFCGPANYLMVLFALFV